MRKIILLSALFFAFCSVLAPSQAASAKTNLITKKKVILEGSRLDPYSGIEFYISFRTGTNKVIGVESPDATVTGFTYSSASATITTITVNDFMIALQGYSLPVDASGDYTVF